jgi:hypothetical protein
MSNVFSRFHRPTGYEYWDNAVEIEIALTRFLMNEKNVPKKYRYVYAIPILNSIRRLQRQIVEAYTTYPTTPERLAKRKALQQDAINTNEVIIQEIQRMILVLSQIDANKLDDIGNRLMRESALLRGWRKSAKIETDKAETQVTPCN